jgi:CDP-glucose 4,6-dehydratase
MSFDLSFYNKKKVFVTGHTGFKGTWLCKVLLKAGANVTGFALAPDTSPSIFELSGIEKEMHSIIGDIRDYNALHQAIESCKPEIIFHLAAQPIVLESYKKPLYTYQTNVMGTVHILECIRSFDFVQSFLNVTTDKVYLNEERNYGYKETDSLYGFDPYSNSKSCSELVTHSYRDSFLAEQNIAVSTARAGNVIGGGDFAPNRIIPDCVRSAIAKTDIIVRNPYSTRPYQHVLEPIFAYLMIAAKQYQNIDYAGSYNVGPDDIDCFETGRLVNLFVRTWGGELTWSSTKKEGPHEANFLKLDCSKLKETFAWNPRWNLDTAIWHVVRWHKGQLNGEKVSKLMDDDIIDYLKSK